MKSKENGFTLVELLVVIAIIGILASIGITSFYFYKKAAFYSSSETTLRNARVSVEGSLNNTDDVYDSFGLIVQSSAGPIQNASAAKFLEGLKLPRNVKFQASYDNSCEDGACMSEFLQVNHCKSDEFVRWLRFGDGIDFLFEHQSGGCG